MSDVTPGTRDDPIVEEVELFHEETPGGSRAVWAYRYSSGAVSVVAQDLGDAPRQFWGADEYEFGVIVSARHADGISLSFIADRFSGARAVDDFRDWANEHGIPCDFWNWVGL